MASFIGFPLFVEIRLVGVMAMFSRTLPDDAVELMASIADTIAQGIARMRAEEKVAEQAALLDKPRMPSSSSTWTIVAPIGTKRPNASTAGRPPKLTAKQSMN